MSGWLLKILRKLILKDDAVIEFHWPFENKFQRFQRKFVNDWNNNAKKFKNRNGDAFPESSFTTMTRTVDARPEHDNYVVLNPRVNVMGVMSYGGYTGVQGVTGAVGYTGVVGFRSGATGTEFVGATGVDVQEKPKVEKKIPVPLRSRYDIITGKIPELSKEMPYDTPEQVVNILATDMSEEQIDKLEVEQLQVLLGYDQNSRKLLDDTFGSAVDRAVDSGEGTDVDYSDYK